VLGISTNPVSTGTGLIQATYVAQGCSIADIITATATLSGGTLTALGTVTVTAAGVGSISFISAVPELIGLQGTGGLGFEETSTVKFKVVDSGGANVVGADVDFSLSTAVGGITLAPATGTSDSAGEVQTVVTSGTVATSVRVTATVVGLAGGTQSSVLVISTGLPDQDSFSWSVACPNVEALGFDGVENDVTVRLADRFQNPVPDGTAVSFTAEGGNIESSCQTTTNATQSGFCTVTWTSSDPRPANGRVTVLATAIGEESFTDGNGNGTFDSATADSFSDLGEQFRDDDESGFYDVGEFFLDFNLSGVHDSQTPPLPAAPLFNGLLCQPSPGSGECATTQVTGIGDFGIIIMSGSAAVITDDLGVGDLAAPGTVTFTIGDVNDQPMPAGTTVAFEANNGTIVGPSDYVVPCTSVDGSLMFPFVVDADGTTSSGAGVLTVTTPGVGGGAGVQSIKFITIDD
jgi:hypothetical protein